jgi:hypothetical protein
MENLQRNYLKSYLFEKENGFELPGGKFFPSALQAIISDLRSIEISDRMSIMRMESPNYSVVFKRFMFDGYPEWEVSYETRKEKIKEFLTQKEMESFMSLLRERHEFARVTFLDNFISEVTKKEEEKEIKNLVSEVLDDSDY